MSSTKLVRSTFSLLALSALAIIMAPPADAQYDAVKRKKKTGVTTGPATATVPAKAVTPGRTAPGSSERGRDRNELAALRTTSDLVLENLGFTGTGYITFELRNRGAVPINSDHSGQVPVAEWIVAQVHGRIDGKWVEVLYRRQLSRLGGRESKTFVDPMKSPSWKPSCGQKMTLRSIVDSTNVIVELTDTNNVTIVRAARPCPDLAIARIGKRFNDSRTEYAARVALVNRGNAPVGSFEYAVSINDTPRIFRTGGPLDPGQRTVINVGRAAAEDRMHVTVAVDPPDVLDGPGLIEELDETNNWVQKVLE